MFECIEIIFKIFEKRPKMVLLNLGGYSIESILLITSNFLVGTVWSWPCLPPTSEFNEKKSQVQSGRSELMKLDRLQSGWLCGNERSWAKLGGHFYESWLSPSSLNPLWPPTFEFQDCSLSPTVYFKVVSIVYVGLTPSI